jgi:hypothetical protein
VFWLSTAVVSAYELQVLGDELEVDEAAAHLLELPRVAGALLFLDAGAHVADVGGGLGPVAALEHVADGGLDGRPQHRGPERRGRG